MKRIAIIAVALLAIAAGAYGTYWSQQAVERKGELASTVVVHFYAPT